MTYPEDMLRNGPGGAFEQTQQQYPYAAKMRAFERQKYPYAARTATFDQQQQYPYASLEPAPTKQRSPLRVVHVGPCFVRGGAEQQTIDLARFLDPNRVRIEKCIVSSPKLFDPRVAADMPAPVEIADAEGIRRAAKEHDAVLCWGVDMDSLLDGCRPGLCVFVAHGDSEWTRRFVDGGNRSVDHVVAVSHRVREKVCNGAQSSVILNGIDTTRLGRTRSRHDARKALGFTDEDFVLGYVGRFSPEKRPELVIEAAAKLPAHFKVVLIGWGPMRGQLMDMANAMIPGRFAFARMDHHLGDYYQVLDTLCLLSESEGFAMVILEAMMCQVPVIATPVGCVREVVVDRVNGIIVDRNAASVCKAVQPGRYDQAQRNCLQIVATIRYASGRCRVGEQSALVRQWILLKVLSARSGGLTIGDLAREMEVSEKTIRRDLSTFKTVGFPIEEATGGYGRKSYRLDAGWGKPDLAFTFDEALALYLGREFLQPLAGTLVWEAAERAFTKIKASLGSHVLRYVDRVGDAFHETSFGASDYSQHADILDALLIGIEDHKVVWITYQSQQATEPVTYDIHPYRLTRHQGSLYLIGLKAQDEELRTWRVDRIEAAEADQVPFTPLPDLDLDAHFARSFGIYDGDEDLAVRVWISKERARYVREKTWHPSQQVKTNRDGSLIVAFRLSSTVEFKSWLLGFGADAEVLEPESLRRELADELADMAQKYLQPQ